MMIIKYNNDGYNNINIDRILKQCRARFHFIIRIHSLYLIFLYSQLLIYD